MARIRPSFVNQLSQLKEVLGFFMRNSTKSYTYSEFSLDEQILRECEAMAKYAFSSGLEVPGTLVESLNILSQELHSVTENQKNTSITSSTHTTTSKARELAKIHNRLAEIVAPATPRTILLLATEEAKGGLFHFLGPVPLIRRMMLAAVISLGAFIIVSLSADVNVESITQNVFNSDGVKLLKNLLFLLSASGLGASFAGLFQANRYVTEGTFDPTYESSYWIRFVLGLMAGMMLSELIPLPEAKAENGGVASNMVVLASPTLAMLGGFSSAVVYRIISRLVETLESLVRGETREIMASRREAAKARSDQRSIQNRLNLAASLTTLQQKVNSAEDIGLVRTELSQILNNLILNRAEEEREIDVAVDKSGAEIEASLPPEPTPEPAPPTIEPSPSAPSPMPPAAPAIGQQLDSDTLQGRKK